VSPAVHGFVAIDLLPMLAGAMAAVSCGLLGNFLVLRRVAMMGDAISHAVLPGIVLGFLIAGTRHSVPIFIGAAAAGIVTVVLVEAVRSYGRVEPGAAMGVVFSVLFALGIVLIETAAARNVDLDADCVLYGQLETLFWFPPESWGGLLTLETLAQLPRQIPTLGATLIAACVFVAVLFKELRLAAFDPALASALGFRHRWLNFALMVLVAATTVAAFEAVGSILVVAMLVCPAATARLLTDRLGTQIAVSIVAALVASLGGYMLGAFGPGWVGGNGSVNAAGTMAVLSGALFVGAFVLSPTHGLMARVLRRIALRTEVAREDVLAAAFRAREGGTSARPARDFVRAAGGGLAGVLGLRRAIRSGELRRRDDRIELTESGAARAARIVRSHRLWEAYLVDEVGLRPDHVHDTAMRLEHLRTGRKGVRLEPDRARAEVDPHDRPIPPRESDDG